MYEEYAHLLISTEPKFSPSPESVADFLAGLKKLGCFPQSSKITVVPRIKVGSPPTTSTFINPFTGESLFYTAPSRTYGKIKSIAKFTDLKKPSNAMSEYDITVTGKGPSPLPPLPIDFDKPYHYSIACSVRTHVVSTSNIFPDCEPLPRKLPKQFDEDCSEKDRTGYFVNPHTSRVIKVPKAGCSKFWVSFCLGKFLFPEIIDDNLEVLDVKIVQFSQTHFGIKFAQGCRPV